MPDPIATIVDLDHVKDKLLMAHGDVSMDTELTRLIISAQHAVSAYTRYEFWEVEERAQLFTNVRLWKRILTRYRPVSGIVACTGRWYGDTTTRTKITVDILDAEQGELALSYSEWWPPHPLAQANPLVSRPSQRPFFPLVQLTYKTSVAPPDPLVDGAAALAAFWARTDSRIDLSSQSFAGVSDSYITDMIPHVIRQRLDSVSGNARVNVG